MACTFTLGSGIVGDITEKLGKDHVVLAFSVMIAISLWLVGGLSSESVVSTWVGLGLCGLFVSGPINLPIPQIMESIELSMDRSSI